MSPASDNIPAMLQGKCVLVTGGSGSIGQELVRQILEQKPSAIRVFSRNEHKQYEMSRRFSAHSNIRYLIGDVRDRERLMLAMEGVDVVFHAAALKHVKACEYNPFEAVKTNVIGTQNAIDAALAHHIELFTAISTDKAVSPTNTMGATKLLSERLVANAANYRGSHKTRFTVVRSGNVLASQGSAIPLFIEQIRNGGPVTLTHPEMKRYFISVKEAVQLCLDASSVSKGGDIFVLKMRPMLVEDLIIVLINELARGFGHNPAEIEIKTIGLSAGERLGEELITPDELANAEELPDYYRIPVSGMQLARPAAAIRAASSNELQALLNKEEIRELLFSTSLLTRSSE
jgi:UDP-N-acetylglucosamine 4,6-dehydratase/5-epimerase